MIYLANDKKPPSDSASIVVDVSHSGAFIAVAIIVGVCVILAVHLLLFVSKHRRHRSLYVVSKSSHFLMTL